MFKNMWTLSNLLSFIRLLLAIPMAGLILGEQYAAAVILGIIAIITDLMDGYLARKLNQVSEFGKIIDPVADKVLVGTIAVCLILIGRLPMWFVIAVLVRDVLILLGGIYASSKIKFVIPSNYAGKITVLLICLAMVLCGLNVEGSELTCFVALGAMLNSLVVYGTRMMKQIKTAESNENNG